MLRQTEILQRLVFWALDGQRPDIVRSNCFTMLKRLTSIAQSGAKITVAGEVQKRIGRGAADFQTAQGALVSGIFPYLLKRQQRALIGHFISKF